jgi:lipoate-protein ligase A
MTGPLRVLDTGLNTARWNVGMTAALVELHQRAEIPATLRFYRSGPAVLLGRHQSLRREVNVVRCQHDGIEIARRMTGGASACMGPGILAFDLVVPRSEFSARLSNSIAWVSIGVAAGIARMGLPARFQPSGSIIIDNCLAGSITASYDSLTLIFQGFIHVSANAYDMAGALGAPRKRAGAEATTNLAAFLGRMPLSGEIIDLVAAGLCDELQRTFVKDKVAEAELELAAQLVSEEFGTEAFVAGMAPHSQDGTRGARQRARGGYVEARVRLAPGARRIDQIWIAGDFSIVPAHAIRDLENALRGTLAETAADHARNFLNESNARILGAAPIDIASVIAAAVKAQPARRSRLP